MCVLFFFFFSTQKHGTFLKDAACVLILGTLCVSLPGERDHSRCPASISSMPWEREQEQAHGLSNFSQIHSSAERSFSSWHWNWTPAQGFDKQCWVGLIKPWLLPQTRDRQTPGCVAGSHQQQQTWKRSRLQPLLIKPFLEPSRVCLLDITASPKTTSVIHGL